VSAGRPHRRRLTIAAAVGACAALLAAAGCSNGPERDGASPTATPSVLPSADAAFPRPLQADRIVEVLVEAQGAGTVFATGVELTSPYFEPGPVADTRVRVSEGWPGHARVPLTRAVCPAGAGPSKARVTLAAANGEPAGEVTVDVADEVLAHINGVECLQRDALDAAQPSFGELGSVEATQARATLVFTRGSSREPVVINGVKGNIIFTVEADAGALPMPMGSSVDSLEVPVTVRASRCDPHAFAESKKTFVFAAWIQVDGREQYVEYQPDPAWRATLQALFDACGEVDRG